MSIDRIDGPRGPHRADPATSRTDSLRDSPEPAAGGDRIELTPEARRIAALARSVDGLPEVRQERIEALRKQVREGSYQVDARQVAQAILEFEQGTERVDK